MCKKILTSLYIEIHLFSIMLGTKILISLMLLEIPNIINKGHTVETSIKNH